MWLTLGWGLPWEVFTRSPHGIVHAAAHQFGKLFLVDSYYLLLRNVIIFILLQSAVLRTILAERRRTLQQNMYGTVVCNYIKQLSKTWQIKQFLRLHIQLIVEGTHCRSSVFQKNPHPSLNLKSTTAYYQNLFSKSLIHFTYPHGTSSVWFISISTDVQARCFLVISNLTWFRRNLLCISDLFLLKTTLSFIPMTS